MAAGAASLSPGRVAPLWLPLGQPKGDNEARAESHGLDGRAAAPAAPPMDLCLKTSRADYSDRRASVKVNYK